MHAHATQQQQPSQEQMRLAIAALRAELAYLKFSQKGKQLHPGFTNKTVDAMIAKEKQQQQIN